MNFPTLAPWMWYAIAGVSVFLLVMWHKELLAWWNTPRGNVPPPPPQIGTTAPKAGVPTRRQVLDYADAIYTYFDDEGCEEGKAAIEIVVKHAFHEHDSEGNPTAVAK